MDELFISTQNPLSVGFSVYTPLIHCLEGVWYEKSKIPGSTATQ